MTTSPEEAETSSASSPTSNKNITRFQPSTDVANAIHTIINHCSVNCEAPLETLLCLDRGSIASWWQDAELEGGNTNGEECKVASHMAKPSQMSTGGFTVNSQVVAALPQNTTVSRLREKIDEMLFKYTEEKLERKRLQKELNETQERVSELESELETLSSKKKKRGWRKK